MKGPRGSAGASGPTGPSGPSGASFVRKATDGPTIPTTAMSDITGLNFLLASGTTYSFAFDVLFQSGIATTGIKLGLTFPAATIVSAKARIPIAADGAGGEFQGWITTSGDSVIGTGVETANTTYIGTMKGVIRPSANGTLQAQVGSEISTATVGVLVKQESMGFLVTVP